MQSCPVAPAMRSEIQLLDVSRFELPLCSGRDKKARQDRTRKTPAGHAGVGSDDPVVLESRDLID